MENILPAMKGIAKQLNVSISKVSLKNHPVDGLLVFIAENTTPWVDNFPRYESVILNKRLIKRNNRL